MEDIVVMKRLLVSKKSTDALTMGIIEDCTITELDISDNQLLNIYLGVVKSVNLDYVEVDYGANQLGILPIENVLKNHFSGAEHKLDIGQSLIVQVVSESESVMLSTFISLTGTSLIFLPKNLNPIDMKSLKPAGFARLKESKKEYAISSDFSLAVLNGHENRTVDELEWDLSVLVHHWQAIKDASFTRESPFLIHQEHNPLISPIKNAIAAGVTEIFVDDEELLKPIQSYLEITNAEVSVYHYDLPGDLIENHRRISWATIKENQKTVKRNSLWHKVTSIFSRTATS